MSENSAELWTSYNNIGEIYRLSGRSALSDLFRARANDLKAAAEERLATYGPRKGLGTKLGTLLEAIVHTEIAMPDASSDNSR